MNLSRPSTYIAAFIAAFSILFMQFAMASYVCPDMGMNGAMDLRAGSNQVQMDGCKGMDAVQPVLCHVHMNDQASKQSLDKPALPDVAAFIPLSLMQVLHPANIDTYPQMAQAESLVLVKTAAPPIAIRNCCFRI